METCLTTWDVTVMLAKKAGISTEQAKAVLQAQAELAYENVDRGFPIPGIGLLCKIETAPRKLLMRFGPDAGQEKLIPGKKVVKFRVAKCAMDIILGHRPDVPDVANQQMELEGPE